MARLLPFSSLIFCILCGVDRNPTNDLRIPRSGVVQFTHVMPIHGIPPNDVCERTLLESNLPTRCADFKKHDWNRGHQESNAREMHLAHRGVPRSSQHGCVIVCCYCLLYLQTEALDGPYDLCGGPCCDPHPGGFEWIHPGVIPVVVHVKPSKKVREVHRHALHELVKPRKTSLHSELVRGSR